MRQEGKAEVGGVRKQALTGVKALVKRMIISQGLRAVSSIYLARTLIPADYGVFAVAAYLTSLGMYFWDIGLSAALVRRDHDPSDDETFTVFCVQQILTVLVVAILVVFTPALAHIYKLPPGASALIVVMSLGLFFSSLRVIPLMLLERSLGFRAIAKCELIESIVQAVSLIILAYMGWGAWALAASGLARGAVGLGLISFASPWRIRGRFRWNIVRTLAPFGIAFQLNALVPNLFGGWMPLVVGRFLGVSALGLVGWAVNLASTPVALTAILYRVAFPAYSRLQCRPEEFAASLRSSIRKLTALSCTAVPFVVIVCPVAIPIIFHPRWQAATPLVQWFTMEYAIMAANGILAAGQSASGFAGDRLVVALLMGAVRAALGYTVVIRWGLIGLGPAMFATACLELCFTGVLVERRTPACRGLVRDAFEPIAVYGAMLVAALACGRWLGYGNPTVESLSALLVLTALISGRELLMRGKGVLGDLRTLYAAVAKP